MTAVSAVAVTAALATHASAAEPATAAHYAANANFDSSGNFVLGADGFNLADIASASEASSLPSGVRGLAYVGQCNGVDATFTSTMTPYIGNAKVYGFYLMDEPDPTGQWSTKCPQANLKAESDWIHSHLPGTKTFVMLMNMSSTSSPSYTNTYTPSNSDIDLYGLDPYPCRTELSGCDYSYITKGVTAAEAAGIPLAQIVPTYQAFGGGSWVDDGGGAYLLPTATQEQQILSTWGSVVPSPAFDYVYSWGSQNGDTALAQSSSLQSVFSAHNAGTSTSPSPSPTSSPTSSPTTSPTSSPTSSGSSAVTFNQGAAFQTGKRVSSKQVSLAKPVAAGDLLVGWFAQRSATGQVQVSDDVNGAWTRAAANTKFSGAGDIALYYVANAKAAPSGVTITVSASSRTILQGSAADYSGVAATGALDQTHVADGTGTAVDSGATASVSAGDLVYGALVTGGSPGSATAGAGFTARGGTSSGSSFEEDVLSSTAGAQDATATLGSATDWHAAVATFHPAAAVTTSPSSSPSSTSSAGAGVTKTLVVMEENHSVDQVFPTGMPYLYSLAQKYGQATNWSDITHPSLPNYLSIFGGSTFGISTDCDPGTSGCAGTAPSVFGQALAAGKTARTYAESAVSNCQTGYDGGYDVNHVPWVYFPAEASQCNTYSVPLGTTSSGALAADITAGTLPSVGEVVPNLTDDGHDGTLAQADSWLQTWLPKIMAGPDYTSGRLAVVVLFDEGETTEQVPMVVLNPGVAGKTVTTSLNHYALTRFIDEVLHTSLLRNASTAPDIAPLFGLTVG